MDELKIESMLAVVFSFCLLHVQLLPKKPNNFIKTAAFHRVTENKVLLSSIGKFFKVLF
jgi:hypothetical protein